MHQTHFFAYYYFHPKLTGARAILSMSVKVPGKYQITYFVYSTHSKKFIPWSDSLRDKAKDCVRQLENDGYERERFKKFNLFENPTNFQPSPLRDTNKQFRIKERVHRAFGLID